MKRFTAVFTMICMWAAMLPMLAVSGCQSNLAALASTLGNAGASIAAIEGNTALATKIQTDTVAAVAAITSWKSGTNAQMALEAIQLVEDDLNLLPINSAYEPLILLALGTAASIIAILNPTAVSAHMPGQRTVTLSNPPKTAKAFKAQWNAICVQHGLSVVI
jgi:hypothetical protein